MVLAFTVIEDKGVFCLLTIGCLCGWSNTALFQAMWSGGDGGLVTVEITF